MGNAFCLDTQDGLTFRTDQDGIIQEVGTNNWNAFANENGAPELDADEVIGRNLFEYIQGEQVRDQLRLVLDRVSQDPNWCWVLPHRCDSPGRERAFCQSIRPVFSENDCTGFVFQSVEQHSRQRPPVHLFNFKMLNQLALEDPTLPVVQMCSWCQRVNYDPVSGGDWISAEDYYAKGGRTNVRISHGICDDCLETTSDPFSTLDTFAKN